MFCGRGRHRLQSVPCTEAFKSARRDLKVLGCQPWCLLSRVSVTGESPPSLSKELTNSLAGVGDVSFDADTQFPLDELKIDPLTLDGLHMLNDPDMVLADPATEDTFRMDRL